MRSQTSTVSQFPSDFSSSVRGDGEQAPFVSVACFSVQAQATASVMPKVIGLFAKLGLVPEQWHSTRAGFQDSELHMDFQFSGLDQAKMTTIAHRMRQMPDVQVVLTSEKTIAETSLF